MIWAKKRPNKEKKKLPTLNNNPSTLIEHFKVLVRVAEEDCGKKRAPLLKKFLKERAQQIIRTPATTHKDSFGCFPGGLLLYTLNMLVVAEQLRQDYFKKVNQESIKFCTFFHYMGHLGDTPDQDLYLEQNDQYYNNRLGFLYKINDKVRFALPTDRLMFLLAQYSIPVSQDEWFALRNYGGAYHKENYAYTSKFTDLEVLVQTASLLTTRLMSNKEFLIVPPPIPEAVKDDSEPAPEDNTSS